MTAGTPEYDHVVIGGGAGGCVVAGRLAEAGASVLLIEAGPGDRSPLLSIPGAGAFAATAKRFNWRYETEPQPELAGRRLYLAQGRVLGGGTSINGMVYTRGFPYEYDQWRDAGCEGWGFSDVLPYFRRSEMNERGANAWHGDQGPLKISRGRSSLPICGMMLEAAQQAGHKLIDDFCVNTGEGFGYYDFAISNGRRSSASAFLRDPTLRRRLTILTSAFAHRLVIENHRAVAVTYRHRGRLQQARARGDIVLAGGAINTPQLLMLSGIGPAEHLRETGIPVVLDQPQIGQNLQNHLCFKLAYATSEPVTAYRYLRPLPAAREIARYLSRRTGFFAEGSAAVGGFFRSAATSAEIDLQLFAPPAVVGLMGKGARALLPSRHGFTFFVSHGRPASRGSVTLKSTNPEAAPRIDPCYLTEHSDLERLVLGVETLREIAAQPALAKVIESELRPGRQFASRADLRQAVRSLATNQFHMAGTCRMGASSTSSVVDPQLRVHGIANLRIADASVMPTLMNGNTAAPVMMIAERAAEFLRATGLG